MITLIVVNVVALIVVIVIVGVLLWLVNAYVPMDQKIKTILNVVVVLLLFLWILSQFGLFRNGGTIEI